MIEYHKFSLLPVNSKKKIKSILSAKLRDFDDPFRRAGDQFRIYM